jgi:predicted transcriptional regulator
VTDSVIKEWQTIPFGVVHMQSDYELIGKVLASNHRLRILNLLAERVMTPVEMAKSLKMERSHVSKTLRELRSLGLVECKNPTLRKGKLFSVTPRGRHTIESLHSLKKSGETADESD